MENIPDPNNPNIRFRKPITTESNSTYIDPDIISLDDFFRKQDEEKFRKLCCGVPHWIKKIVLLYTTT